MKKFLCVAALAVTFLACNTPQPTTTPADDDTINGSVTDTTTSTTTDTTGLKR